MRNTNPTKKNRMKSWATGVQVVHAPLVTSNVLIMLRNPAISHERGKHGIGNTANGRNDDFNLTLNNEVCQWLARGRFFLSQCTLVYKFSLTLIDAVCQWLATGRFCLRVLWFSTHTKCNSDIVESNDSTLEFYLL